MHKIFEYDLGRIVVLKSNLQTYDENMKLMNCVEIADCMSLDGISTMDLSELDRYVEFLQEVRKEMF